MTFDTTKAVLPRHNIRSFTLWDAVGHGPHHNNAVTKQIKNKQNSQINKTNRYQSSPPPPPLQKYG